VVNATDTPTPTATRTATPTATATPAQTCSPRPRVGLELVPGYPGQLFVRVTAFSNATATNNLLELRFGAGQNAQMEAGSQTGSGNFTVQVPQPASNFGFRVLRVTPGQAVTVPFVAVDRCGEWPTFVGGGPSAF
jgi:hypothetical protein